MGENETARQLVYTHEGGERERERDLKTAFFPQRKVGFQEN